MTTAKKYTVLNPREIPKELPIIRSGNRSWYEGQIFEKPVTMSEGDVKALVQRGFLKAG